MIENERELFSKLEDLRMEETKRTLMRSELAAFADLHAVTAKEEATRFNSVAFLSTIFTHSRKLMAASLVVVMVLVTGTATTYASERAVPGELLYTVKVAVAEPVASVFAGEGVSQARFHAKLALRRVEEAAILESRGELTAEHAEELSTRFVHAADKAEQQALELASSGDYSASLAVRTELATELSAFVADTDLAPTTDIALATEVRTEESTASQATMMKMAAEPVETSEPLEFARGEVSLTPFKQLVSRKIASLRVNTNPREDLHEKFATSEVEEVASSDTRKGKQVSAARTLLLGASVSQEEASSTATSTSLDGVEIIKEILKAKKPIKQEETAPQPEQEPTVDSGTDDAESGEPDTTSSSKTPVKDVINSVTNAVGAGSLLP